MIRINTRKVLIALLAIDLLLVAAYIITQLTDKLELPFNLDREANVAVWFAGVQLLLIAFPAALRGLQLRQEDRRSHWKIYILGALACVFLSADEIGMIHETLRSMLKEPGRLDYVSHTSGKSAVGVVVDGIYGAVGLVLFAVFWKDALKFLAEQRGRIPILAGAAMFVIGALFVDELMPYAFPLWEHALEELLELCGTSLVLYGFLLKMRPLTIDISRGAPKSTSPPFDINRRGETPPWSTERCPADSDAHALNT